MTQAAQKLNVSYWTMANYVRKHQIEAIKIGQRWRIPMSAIAQFVKNKEKNEKTKEE